MLVSGAEAAVCSAPSCIYDMCIGAEQQGLNAGAHNGSWPDN